MREATVLAKMTEHRGLRPLLVVTDAYLLGLAIQQNLILITLDKALLHLAGKENSKHVLLLAYG